MDEQARIPVFRKGAKENIWPHQASVVFGAAAVSQLQRYVPKDIFDYYARCKRALFLSDWISGMSVHDLEQKYTLVDNSFCRLTYAHIISITSMTRFHLKPASEIASLILLGQQSIGDGIDRLLKRIEFGLPEDALSLLDLPIRMERGDYLNLFNNGIHTTEQFWTTPADKVGSIIGKRLAERFEKHRETVKK